MAGTMRLDLDFNFGDFSVQEDDVSDESNERFLDENGLPSFRSSRQEIGEGRYESNLGLDARRLKHGACARIECESQVEGTEEEEEGSFASEFYTAGTDWSCLIKGKEEEENEGETVKIGSVKKMKQADLFQMWGLQKKTRVLHSQGKGIAIWQANDAERPDLTADGFIGTSGAKRNREMPRSRSRQCPFYKKIPGTPFTVDAFRYGCIPACSAYFLTHFHYDHYGGLSKGWSHGPIYCTAITARLLMICLSIQPKYIYPLDLEAEYVIEGIKVTLLEANHCPGAALIHLVLPSGKCYLHTGDFRASKEMQAYNLLKSQRVEVVYLDTTYCNPRYKFPTKEAVLHFVVGITEKFLKKQRKTLVVVGAYSIGKECVYLALAKALGVKIFANTSRIRVLQSFGWTEVSSCLCTDGKDTPLHVLPMSSLRVKRLRDYLSSYANQYTAVLAFRPTGWTYSEAIGNQLDRIRPTTKGNITIYGVPYSEHSSFTELREFIQFLRPSKIIPTVNIWNAASREKMQSYFQEWLRA